MDLIVFYMIIAKIAMLVYAIGICDLEDACMPSYSSYQVLVNFNY